MTEARRIKDMQNSETVRSDENIYGPTACGFALRFLHFTYVCEGKTQNCLCLAKYREKETYRGMEVRIQAFLYLTLDRSRRSINVLVVYP
jgi:hypothetical protein